MQADASVIDTLRDLVAIKSVNPNYVGGVEEEAIASYVEAFFRCRDIETWRQQVFPGRPNIVARIPGKSSSRRIVMEAHLDTVSAAGMTIEPWRAEIKDGKLFGRGACDTKGGMAAMMHAMSAVARSGKTPPCELVFAATIDEEFSFRGVVALCQSFQPGDVPADVVAGKRPGDALLRADAAIVAEPTELRCVVASKGLVRWKIETHGKAAHSAKPHLGVNAIEQMARVVTAIEQDNLRLAQTVHPLLGPATCNVGVIRGGRQINFVPDHCEIEIDRRMLPGEHQQEVLAHYERMLTRLGENDPHFSAQCLTPLLGDLPLDTPQEAECVRAMGRVLNNFGLSAEPTGVPFCSDASKFGAIGIPTMILGPGSIDQAHSAVEYVACAEVERAAEIYQQFLLTFQPNA